MNLKNTSNIIAWIFIILGVIFVLWKIIGGSPSEFNILIVLVSGILFKMISIGDDVSSLKVKVKNIENKFNALATDFKEHVKNK